jgi:hypothetical protein
MTNKPFEKQIADKMNRHEVQPGEGLLQSIFEKRAAQRKPFMGLAKVFFAAAIIAVAISALYIYDRGKDDGTAVASADQPNSGTDKTAASVAPEVKNQSAGMTETKSNPSEPVKTYASKTDKLNNDKSGKLSQPSARRHARHVASTENIQNRNRAMNNNSHGLSNDAVSASYADNGEDISNRYFNIYAKNRPRIESSRHKGNSHLYVYHSVSEEVLETYSAYYLPVRPLGKLAHNYNLEKDAKLANQPSHMPTLSRGNRKPLFIDILYTPILTLTKAYNNPGLESYVNSIAANTYSAQYGVRVSVPVAPKVNIFGGLFFQDQSCSYNGNVNRLEDVTRINTVVTYINDPVQGSIKVTSYDTVTSPENKQTTYRYKNTYKMFQVPLGFSYNFGYRKFDFAFNTSALVNMVSSSNGHYMDLKNSNTGEFSSSSKYIGLGGGFSLMSAVKISPRFRFILEPGIQYFSVNSLKAGNNVNEKVFNKQLSIGLRYSVF